MTARRLLVLTAASGALVAAVPAIAQTDGAVIYESAPVVQPVPGETAIILPDVVEVPADQVTVYEVEPHAPAPLPPPPVMEAPMPAPPAAPAYYGDAAYGHGYPAPYPSSYYPAAQPQFDREAWLSDCRERIRGVHRKDRAGVIGGLLGAIAGGVIGNRAWGSERLAGTLLGAGVGGLAGVAIGNAVGAEKDRKRADECAWYLDRYTAAPQGYPGYGYGYYPAVTYVPVLMAVPQRAVVREYVTEEWVDGPPAPQPRTVTQTKVIRQSTPAPRADKRTKLIRAK